MFGPSKAERRQKREEGREKRAAKEQIITLEEEREQ